MICVGIALMHWEMLGTSGISFTHVEELTDKSYLVHLYHMRSQPLFHTEKFEKCLYLVTEVESKISIQKSVNSFYISIQNSV